MSRNVWHLREITLHTLYRGMLFEGSSDLRLYEVRNDAKTQVTSRIQSDNFKQHHRNRFQIVVPISREISEICSREISYHFPGIPGNSREILFN